MSKRVLKIVLLIVCAAILALAYFALTKIGSGDESDTTATPAISYTVAKVDLNTVFQFGYTYKGEEYSFRLNDAGDAWIWDSHEELPISNVKMALMLTYFSEMTSTLKLESIGSSERTEYGFDEPTLELFFKDNDGVYEYTVGITNTYNSMVYICSKSDPSTAYMVKSDFLEEYTSDSYELLQIEECGSLSTSENITLKIEKGEDKLVFNYYPTGKSDYISSACKWFLSINGGEEFPINEKLGSDLLSAFKVSIFAEVVTYDEEKYSDYGLEKKECKVTLSGTQVTVSTDSSTGEESETKEACSFEFYLGSMDEDGFSYAMTDNSPLLYLTTSAVYDEMCSFDKSNINSIYSAYVWNVEADDVDEIVFTVGEKSYTLSISESAISVKYTVNGKEVSYDSVKTLIEAASAFEWDNDTSKISEGDGEKKAVLNVKITAGTATAELEICGYSDEYYRIVYGERDEFLMTKSNFDMLIGLITSLEQ